MASTEVRVWISRSDCVWVVTQGYRREKLVGGEQMWEICFMAGNIERARRHAREVNARGPGGWYVWAYDVVKGEFIDPDKEEARLRGVPVDHQEAELSGTSGSGVLADRAEAPEGGPAGRVPAEDLRDNAS